MYFQLYIFKTEASYKLALTGSVGSELNLSWITKMDRVKKSTSRICGTLRYENRRSKNQLGRGLANRNPLSVPEGLYLL